MTKYITCIMNKINLKETRCNSNFQNPSRNKKNIYSSKLRIYLSNLLINLSALFITWIKSATHVVSNLFLTKVAKNTPQRLCFSGFCQFELVLIISIFVVCRGEIHLSNDYATSCVYNNHQPIDGSHHMVEVEVLKI